MGLVMRRTICCTSLKNAALFFKAQGALEKALREGGTKEEQARELAGRVCAVKLTWEINPTTQAGHCRKMRFELDGYGDKRAVTYTLNKAGEITGTHTEIRQS